MQRAESQQFFGADAELLAEAGVRIGRIDASK